MDKIDENYFRMRINDSRKNWYIYFYSDPWYKGMGIIERETEREAYVKFFDKFPCFIEFLGVQEFDNPIISKRRAYINYASFFWRHAHDIMRKMYNNIYIDDKFENECKSTITSALSSDDKEEQYILDNLKYKCIKDFDNRGECAFHGYLKIYIKKY